MSDPNDYDPTDPTFGATAIHTAWLRRLAFGQNATSLQAAVKNGDKVAVKEELQKNSESWKFIDEKGQSMLHLAIEFVEPEKSTWVQQEQRPHFRNNPRYIVQLRANQVPEKIIIEILEIFLDLGLDINARNKRGETPLWLGVKYRMNEVIEFLVERGADVNVRNENGDTLAHMIVKEEIDPFCWYYGEFKNFPRDRRGNTAFWDWLLSKSIDVDCQNASGETAFRLALKNNFGNISWILAKYTNEVNFINNDGQNILHILLDMELHPYHPIFYSILRILLEKGVSVNAVDNRGRTPLHVVAKRRQVGFLLQMLEHFTNVNACDDLGDTVLHIAIDSFHLLRLCPVIPTLISKGANIYMKNKNGMTPVQLAAKHKDEEVLRLLQESQADFSLCTDDGETLLHLYSRGTRSLTADPDMVDLLVKQGCDVNATNVHGFTPLHLAATAGYVAVVKCLLKHGADVHSRDTRDQRTPLHLAALQGREETMKELVIAGADVNSKEATGKTPLHLAARHPDTLLKTLLKFGAFVDAKDNNGRMPLNGALLNDNFEGLDCLLEYGADMNDLGTLQQIPFFEEIRNRFSWDRVVKHLVMLKAAKMPIASVLKPYIDISSEPMKTFFMECLEEIEDMKKIMIAGRRSVYDLLLLDPYRRYTYVRTMKFQELLISPCYFQYTFLKYCGLILSSYNEAIERKPLLEPAKYAWYQLTKISLPDICIERVLFYLKNSELKTMIEGAEIVMET